MSKVNNFYYIPSGITKNFCNLIEDEFSDKNLKLSTVGGHHINLDVRNSKNFWIPTDHWISGMMYHFINCANNSLFNYDICQWSEKIQYTVYGGVNTHYDWHIDMSSESSPYQHNGIDLIRKLSISLCLSSKNDYEGGEFQIMHTPKNMQTIKMDVGDVIVFSSDASHRVRKLKSGKRVSLVGWFAGPKFK